jgi:hypothetical protein
MAALTDAIWRVRGKRLALLVLMAACIGESACQGTVHNRWAREDDSVDAWAPKLAILPIDVHGTIPGENEDQALQRIANSTDGVRYARGEGGGSLLSAQRIVLYVGGDSLPVNTTYCDGTPTPRTIKIPAGKIMMGAALCDGSRLVVTVRQEFRPKA